MNDDALDYGDPAETEMQAGDIAGEQNGPYDDQEMDAEMLEWEDQYDGDMDEFEQRKEQRIQELRQAKEGVKFYPLPREEGISAGANRGVTSRQVELDDGELLGPEEDLPPPEMPSLIGGGQDIRYSVLHLSGPPVTQCSTSRLFAYVTHFGAQPLGLEWVNDSSCNIVFSDASAARLAIEYLCPAVSISYAPLVPLPNDQELDQAVHKKKQLDNPDGEDVPSDWDEVFLQSLLFPRKAHRIPGKLYNAPERDAAAELREQQEDGKTSSLPEDVPEIYREMEAEDRKKRMLKPEQANLQKLRGPLWLRWASESLDVKPNRAAKQSKWYQEHGSDAGKEVVTKLLNVGGVRDRLELLPSGSGEDRQRGSKQRRNEGDRGSGGRQAVMDDLDAEMDQYRDRGENSNSEARLGGIEDERSNRPFLSTSQYQTSRKGRGNRNGRMAMEALDEELELNRRDRSASPIRQQSNYNQRVDRGAGTSPVKVKGRGRMKAPSAWDDVDDANSGGMMADDYNGRGQGSRRGGQRGKWNQGTDRSSLEQRMSQSLEQRLSGGNHLLDRMN